MTILDEILAHKVKEIQTLEYKRKQPERKIQSLIERLADAVDIAIIAEIKRGSPSKGYFAKTLDIPKQIMLYNQHASCISVLTDNKFFFGSYEDLRQVRALTDLPILCKDFIIDERQIDQAYADGADVILLIAKALTVEKLEALLTYAHALHMEVLIEISSMTEFQSIEHLPFSLAGINNRNLDDFSISYENTVSLAQHIQSTGRYVISESGIQSRLDILKLRGHIDGVLIGEALVKTPALLPTLTFRKRPLKVKICGIQSTAIAQYLDDKVEMIGIVLTASKRRINANTAKAIRGVVKVAALVGVFKGEDVETINDAIDAYGLDYVQLHEPTSIASITLPHHRIICAVPYTQLERIDHPLILIDNHKPGSGKTFPLDGLTYRLDQTYILAGGLMVDNLNQRLKDTRFTMVDVSSGVEHNHKKDKHLIDAFLQKTGEI